MSPLSAEPTFPGQPSIRVSRQSGRPSIREAVNPRRLSRAPTIPGQAAGSTDYPGSGRGLVRQGAGRRHTIPGQRYPRSALSPGRRHTIPGQRYPGSGSTRADYPGSGSTHFPPSPLSRVSRQGSAVNPAVNPPSPLSRVSRQSAPTIPSQATTQAAPGQAAPESGSGLGNTQRYPRSWQSTSTAQR